MATNSLHSVHHHHHHHSLSLIRQENACAPASLAFLRPAGAATATAPALAFCLANNNRNAAAAAMSESSSAAATVGESSSSLECLRRHLEAGEFREADEETRRLVIVLAGEGAQKRGYVFFSEVQYIPEGELRAIDELWREHSGGRFGYSVQKKIFTTKANRDFTSFFIRLGWMKKVETADADHYNYRSFPSEFIWEISDETPLGHLPLTNALRGTQLLNSIFSHPAFDDGDTTDDDDSASPATTTTSSASTAAAFNNKPNYSF